MKNQYYYGALIFSAFLFFSQPGFSQKTMVLENYTKSRTTSKVSRELKQLSQEKLINQASSARKLVGTPTIEDFMPTKAIQQFGDYVVIDALSKPDEIKKLTKDLKKLGLKDPVTFKSRISGLLPIKNILALEQLSALQVVRPSYKPFSNAGDVTSRGDKVMSSDQVRKKTGFAGRGIKVGVISDSYNNQGGAADGVASDDLPQNVQVLKDIPSGGIDEGRAMAEIVHDVASRSDIAFHTAFISELDFARGIERLADAGCDVIVDDVIYFAEPFFMNGPIAQSVDKVFRRGVTYLSSAGNQGRDSYESKFNNLGVQLVDSEGFLIGYPHDFGGGDIYQDFILPPGASLALSFQWSDPFYSVTGDKGAETDMDFYFVIPEYDLLLPVASDNAGLDPSEIASITNPFDDDLEVQLLIVKYSGPDPDLMKYVNFGAGYEVLEYETNSSTIFGHADTNGAIAVGATAWFNTPEFNDNISKPVINYFSSVGGTLHMFDNQGNKIAKPYARKKPEVVGPDGGNTTFFGNDLSFSVPRTDEPDGYPNFFGTSASAPHVAGVAAIMLEATYKSISPRDVENALIGSTNDMDDPFTPGFDKGFDYGTGYGFVRAPQALDIALDLVPDLEAIVPIFEGVYFNTSTGKYDAYFGYNNKNDESFEIPAGPNNRFKEKTDLGQVTEFFAGRQTSSFKVPLEDGETITWSLKGPDLRRRNILASASETSPAARISTDGKELSGVTSETQAVNVYPNYSDGPFNLEINATKTADVWVGIYDDFGNEVQHLTGKSSQQYAPDLSRFGKGIYTIVVNVDNMLTTKKVIVR